MKVNRYKEKVESIFKKCSCVHVYTVKNAEYRRYPL